MTNVNAVITRAKELLAAKPDLTAVKLRACLVLEDYKAKDIDAAVKAVCAVNVRVEFRAVFHTWLVNNNPTEAEAKAYIMGRGEFGDTSDNTKKHLSVFMNEWELAKRAREAAIAELKAAAE